MIGAYKIVINGRLAAPITPSNSWAMSEKRLYNYIMRPAMLFSWIFGIVLIYLNGLDVLTSLWMQIKLVLVIILSIYHEYLGKCMRLLKLGKNEKSSKFYRIINEIPTILLIGIILVVVFKPL